MTNNSHLYRDFSSVFLGIAKNIRLDLKGKLIVLFMYRSVAAAHALRVLYIENTDTSKDKYKVRFRHRRLAEYYAACHLKNQWSVIKVNLKYRPWLGPIFNLTCALEGGECNALSWLITQVDENPQNPLYLWRYSVETAVEASFFSEASIKHKQLIEALLSKLINVLTLPNLPSVSNETFDKYYIDPITKITILHSIERLAKLNLLLSRKVTIDPSYVNRLSKYESNTASEWIPQVAFTISAFNKINSQKYTNTNKLKTLWALIRQPSSIIAQKSINFERFSWFWFVEKIVKLTTIIGEIALILLYTLIIILVILGYAFLIAQDHSKYILQNEYKYIIVIFIFSFIAISRIYKCKVSPTLASQEASLVFRALHVVYEWSKNISNGRFYRRLFIKIIRVLIDLGSFLISILPFATLLVLGSVLFVIFSNIYNSNNPIRCFFVNRDAYEIASHFQAEAKNSNNYDDVNRLINQTNYKRNKLSANNVNSRCKYKDSNLLSEKWLDARLKKLDKELLLSSLKKPQVFTSEQANELDDLINSSPKEEQKKILIKENNELAAYRNDFEDANSHNISLVDKKTNDEYIKSINDQIKINANRIEEINEKNMSSTVKYVLIVLAIGLVIWVIVITIKYFHDLKKVKLIQKIHAIAELLNYISDYKYSENIRSIAIDRLREIGIESTNELSEIENVVGKLHESTSGVDKNLAVKLASVSRTLANRIRHSIS